MREKYKFKRGSDLPHSKLTEDDVRMIRSLHEYKKRQVEMLNETLGIKALAEKYGVHERTIEKVLSYDGWRHA